MQYQSRSDSANRPTRKKDRKPVFKFNRSLKGPKDRELRLAVRQKLIDEATKAHEAAVADASAKNVLHIKALQELAELAVEVEAKGLDERLTEAVRAKKNEAATLESRVFTSKGVVAQKAAVQEKAKHRHAKLAHAYVLRTLTAESLESPQGAPGGLTIEHVGSSGKLLPMAN